MFCRNDQISLYIEFIRPRLRVGNAKTTGNEGRTHARLRGFEWNMWQLHFCGLHYFRKTGSWWPEYFKSAHPQGVCFVFGWKPKCSVVCLIFPIHACFFVHGRKLFGESLYSGWMAGLCYGVSMFLHVFIKSQTWRNIQQITNKNRRYGTNEWIILGQ